MSRVIIVTNRAKLGKVRPARNRGGPLNPFPVKVKPWGETAAEKYFTALQLVQYRAASSVLDFMRSLNDHSYRGSYVHHLISERERRQEIADRAEEVRAQQ